MTTRHAKIKKAPTSCARQQQDTARNANLQDSKAPENVVNPKVMAAFEESLPHNAKLLELPAK